MLLRAFLCLTILSCSVTAYAQENGEVLIQGKRYLDINIRSLNKYAIRIERTQKQLLRRLKRKEQRLERLLHTDSAAYARFMQQPVNFDSISRLATSPDSASFASRTRKGGQRAVDSLKGIYRFIQSKASDAASNKAVTKVAALTGYDNQLNELQGRLSYDQYINELTNKHALSLEGISGKNNGIIGIQKELFYAKAKMKEWQQLADDPSRLEERALEYLQGTKGFDLSMKQSLNGGSNANSMGGAVNVADLETMGFQTKRQLSTALQQKFGNSLQAVQGNLGKQLSSWQDKANSLQEQARETKQSLSSLKQIDKPDFKLNPMRGKPFWMRLEKQYSFNVSRATTLTDGSKRPALLTPAVSVAYRHTPKLATGIGIAGEIGLGESWSNIRFTFEGIGIRGFSNWELQYGIGLYAGYERTWKRFAFQPNGEAAMTSFIPSSHNGNNYSEALLFGLSKKYKINSKYNGAVQVLFDAWWQQKELRTPIIIRFVNSK